MRSTYPIEIFTTFLNKNKITHVREGTFRGLEQLQRLTLSENELTYIGENAFSSPSKLISLFLNANNLTELEDDNLFADLTKLKVLCSFTSEWKKYLYCEHLFKKQ